MNPWQADVAAFRRLMDQPSRETPGWPEDWKGANMQFLLVMEEFRELDQAWENEDLPETADAIVDLLYVTIGLACVLGIDLGPLWDAVQASNIAKINGPVRADGKKEKPPGWIPPDIAGLLRAQGWQGESTADVGAK